MQAGAYQNGTWVVGVAKGGVEEGVDSLAQSVHRRPERPDRRAGVDDRRRADHGRLRPRLVPALQGTLFDFDRYRRPELYGRITTQRGVGAVSRRSRRSHESRSPSTAAGRRAGGPPAPARRPPRGARRHLAQGRLLAVGPVRLLHRARRRQGRRVVPAVARQGGRASRSSPSKASTTTSAPATPTPSPPAAACSAASASPASSCGPRPRSTRRAPTSPARTWPATSAPTCAGAPAT